MLVLGPQRVDLAGDDLLQARLHLLDGPDRVERVPRRRRALREPRAQRRAVGPQGPVLRLEPLERRPELGDELRRPLRLAVRALDATPPVLRPAPEALVALRLPRQALRELPPEPRLGALEPHLVLLERLALGPLGTDLPVGLGLDLGDAVPLAVDHGLPVLHDRRALLEDEGLAAAGVHAQRPALVPLELRRVLHALQGQPRVLPDQRVPGAQPQLLHGVGAARVPRHAPEACGPSPPRQRWCHPASTSISFKIYLPR